MNKRHRRKTEIQERETNLTIQHEGGIPEM